MPEVKLVTWIMACAFGFATGWLIGAAIINTIGYEGAMSATGVLITALLAVLYIRTGRDGK